LTLFVIYVFVCFLTQAETPPTLRFVFVKQDAEYRRQIPTCLSLGGRPYFGDTATDGDVQPDNYAIFLAHLNRRKA
jgi:hypothetical protein